jgi:hypothetical protein
MPSITGVERRGGRLQIGPALLGRWRPAMWCSRSTLRNPQVSAVEDADGAASSPHRYVSRGVPASEIGVSRVTECDGHDPLHHMAGHDRSAFAMGDDTHTSYWRPLSVQHRSYVRHVPPPSAKPCHVTCEVRAQQLPREPMAVAIRRQYPHGRRCQAIGWAGERPRRARGTRAARGRRVSPPAGVRWSCGRSRRLCRSSA